MKTANNILNCTEDQTNNDTKHSINKTIFALSTILGVSGVAIIRISGPNALDILKLGYINKKPKPKEATLCNFEYEGKLIDKCIVIYFQGPASFTGLDVVELHIHGSVYIIRKILEILSTIEKFQPALPGEFVRQAYDNNKMNINEVESLFNILHSETELEHSISWKNDSIVDVIYSKIFDMLVYMESKIDFSTEDDIDDDMENIYIIYNNLLVKIREYLSTWSLVKKARSGCKVALIGNVNVGKSSIINAITGQSISIVSSKPGTTTDSVNTLIEVGGMKVKLIDCAGIRASKEIGLVEKIGIRKTKKLTKESDIILYVIDGSKKDAIKEFYESKKLHMKKSIIVINKIDKIHKSNTQYISDNNLYNSLVQVSAKNNIQISYIISSIENKIESIKNVLQSNIIKSQREHDVILHIHNELKRVFENSRMVTLDILVHQIKGIMDLSCSHFGTSYNVEQILGSIFGKFCIGK